MGKQRTASPLRRSWRSSTRLTGSIQQIEKIYETLEENNIEVTNDLETATFDIPDEDLLPDDIDESPEEVEEMLLQEGVTIDDPVRMYLKDIGKVPLLSADKELELAYKMSLGDEEAKKQLGRSQSSSGRQHRKTVR